MTRNANSKGTGTSKLVGFALTTALASATLAGCAASAPPAAVSASKAEAALAKGKYTKAIEHAEAAVMAEPRNGSYRAMLGAAYLEAGRFASAATSFQDAIELGESSPRTALSLALALTAEGKQGEATRVLDEWKDTIGASDLGLAYALAGDPVRGVNILTNAIRDGENTPKVRQNLAYSFALAGRWKEARLMASEDIPADKVGFRIEEWAAQVHPDLYRTRVASLLSVPAAETDPGQPVQLALANFPTADQLALEAVQPEAPAAKAASAQPAASSVASASAELPAMGDPVDARAAAAPAPRATAMAGHETAGTLALQTPARTSVPASTVATDSRRFLERESARQLPSRSSAPTAVRTAAGGAAPVSGGEATHLVQLGSFSSEKGARRAWGIYVQRYPELAGHDMVITRAVVRGKEYFRVSAAGYDSRSSRAMCGRVNSSPNGEGCFAYAESNPLPGAVDTGRRFAMK